MAKSDFICDNCKQVATFGIFESKVRYECPKHGCLCKECVETHLLKRATCKVCGSKLLQFRFTNNRWEKD